MPGFTEGVSRSCARVPIGHPLAHLLERLQVDLGGRDLRVVELAIGFIGAHYRFFLPPKEPLIEEVLYRRDRISLTGRRRNGKTTLLHNLALAAAAGLPNYLAYRIPRPFSVLSFYLEDDARELQDKLGRMKRRLQVEVDLFHLYTREDLWGRNSDQREEPEIPGVCLSSLRCVQARPGDIR